MVPGIWWTDGMNWPGLPQGPACFEMVPDAKRVCDLLRQTQAEGS